MRMQQYQENPLLFLNTTGPSVPSGRNVRAQARTQQASLANATPTQGGYFGQIQLNGKHTSDVNGQKTPQKRRRTTSRLNGQTAKYADRQLTNGTLKTGSDSPLDPSEVLAVATFHIRRIAAMTIRQHPERLRDVLRCRQWSCISIAFQRTGKCSCLDAALFAVAAKLRQITGGGVSAMLVLSTYTEALHELQGALLNPGQHDSLDLLTTTQLLAVYEMLDSLDEETWSQHIAGAISLARPLEIMPDDMRKANKLTFSRAAPIFTDALLTGNDEVLHRYPWRRLLQSAFTICPRLPEVCRGPMNCLIELPELLEDARVDHIAQDPSGRTALVILDRAHMLKDRLRKDLTKTDLYYQLDPSSILESFDLLGLCLAALVALDRVIAALQSMTPQVPGTTKDTTQDTTNELCAQLLQLELGAADAYPAADLMRMFQMSTFQEYPGFIIVLPGGQR